MSAPIFNEMSSSTLLGVATIATVGITCIAYNYYQDRFASDYGPDNTNSDNETSTANVPSAEDRSRLCLELAAATSKQLPGNEPDIQIEELNATKNQDIGWTRLVDTARSIYFRVFSNSIYVDLETITVHDQAEDRADNGIKLKEQVMQDNDSDSSSQINSGRFANGLEHAQEDRALSNVPQALDAAPSVSSNLSRPLDSSAAASNTFSNAELQDQLQQQHNSRNGVVIDNDKFLREDDKEQENDKDDDDSEEEVDDDEYDDNDDDDEEEEDYFQEVKEVLSLDAIRQVAIGIRSKQQNEQLNEQDGPYCSGFLCTIDPEPMSGTFNLVYIIEWTDGLKWVARVPGNGRRFNELDAVKMNSEYKTMEYIRKHTMIPIPEVFYWDTGNRTAGVPFALMSFVEGRSVLEFWHDNNTKEEQRLAVLGEIASNMSQLIDFKFPKMGILTFDDADHEPCVGPAILTHRRCLEDFWGFSIGEGPYDSLKEYLLMRLDDYHYPSKRSKCTDPIYRLAINSIPDFMCGQDNFSISPPDFNYQNILINADGQVVGIIDWDKVNVEPVSSGCGRYPSWITRDWEPAVYCWGQEDFDDDPLESPPDVLSKYRQHYLEAFVRARGGDYDHRQTKLSHILEAINIGITNIVSKSGNARKLLEYAGIKFSLKEFADAYMEDETEEMERQIKAAFQNMWHAEWEPAEM